MEKQTITITDGETTVQFVDGDMSMSMAKLAEVAALRFAQSKDLKQGTFQVVVDREQSYSFEVDVTTIAKARGLRNTREIDDE